MKTLCIVLGSIIGAIALVLLSAHLVTPLVYSEFFSAAEAKYEIPGMSDGFIQQGYTYFEGKNVFLHSGYMKDDTASRIYIIDANDTSKVKYVSLATADGEAYDAHSGGIAAYGDTVWLAKSSGKDCLWKIDAAELLASENGDTFVLNDPFYVDCNASFCHADENYVWVGEFMDKGEGSDYEFNTSDGTVNAGLLLAYDRENAEKLDEATPQKVFSIGDTVQGMTTFDDMIVLVTSSGINTSHLYFYTQPSDDGLDDSATIDGNILSISILDSNDLLLDVSMQPMAEEIAVNDGKIYVSFESASQKYIFGNFTRGRHVYAYVPQLEE